MLSFLAVTSLSFFTLCLGTYVADLVEARKCSACGQVINQHHRSE